MPDKVHLEVVTPIALLVDREADMVVVPGGDGDFGVLPGHAPLISTLRPGTIEVYEGERVAMRVFVESGFAEVSSEGLTVVAEAATPGAKLAAKDAEARLARARETRSAAETDSERLAAEVEIAVAEAMLAAASPTERR